MTDRRRKDISWALDVNADGTVSSADARLAVLMDIRDEHKKTNNLLGELVQLARCYRIPRALDAVIELGKAERRRLRLRRAKAKKTRKRK